MNVLDTCCQTFRVSTMILLFFAAFLFCPTAIVRGENETSIDPQQIRFFLYRQSSIQSPVEFKIDDTLADFARNFDSNLPTVIFTHGYLGSYLKEASQTMKDGYLHNMDVNVILVDYEPYNQHYELLVSRIKDIAKAIAKAVNFLLDIKLMSGNLHMIGHSMGAHITGLAANDVKIIVPRCTGLDPAGPMFKNASASDRINPDVAKFVDCIHTSGLGISKPICTVDFFVNGGSNQPNCINLTKVEEKVGCDHQESFRYYVQTIAVPQAFEAAICPKGYSAGFNAQDCSSAKNVVMGYKCSSSTKPGVYYARLSEKQPPSQGSSASTIISNELKITFLLSILCPVFVSVRHLACTTCNFN